ncbi:MAG: GyrI-like domain-containing protein [Bacteroidota bacterium]
MNLVNRARLRRSCPAGKYAVFPYKGRPSEAMNFYQYIFVRWMPQSAYAIDSRPHFALMGDKYKG